MNATWEKIFEYASMPLHGTMSRKLRTGVRLQINEAKIYDSAVLFLGDSFVRLTEKGTNGEDINTYFAMDQIQSLRTYSQKG